MVHRGPRRLGAAFRFLQPPPPRSPALQNAKLPPAGAPPSGRPRAATSASRAAWARGPGAGGPGQRSAASGAGRACGRAPRRRSRGRAERAREGARAARRAALVQRGKPKYQFQTLGKHSAPCTAHAPRPPAPSLRAPPPPHSRPSPAWPRGGVALSVTFARAGVVGVGGSRRGANFTRSSAFGARTVWRFCTPAGRCRVAARPTQTQPKRPLLWEQPPRDHHTLRPTSPCPTQPQSPVPAAHWGYK